ncbi:MAG TPA: helix-turn-helix domain-containing protein [Nitrososphaerales archaeon]|nr:helix-turn-helix domain-containing protein [Nitrososphaerales archaeon]
MQPSSFIGNDGDKTSSEAHLSALASIGLSQYEGKCFLASLQTGPATINQIGIVAGVPRTKVYGAVRKLVERGLLVQNEDDEKIFVARSPREVLIPLLEKEQRRISQGLEALTELEVIHQSMGYVKRAEALRSKVLRYYPRLAVTRKTRDLFQNATKKIVILSTANGLIRLSRLSGILFERSRTGLQIEIRTGFKDEPVFHTAIQSLKEIENTSVFLSSLAIPIQIIVVDGQYVLISELKPDDLREEGMDVAFLIQSSEMAEMIEALVREFPLPSSNLATADDLVPKS